MVGGFPTILQNVLDFPIFHFIKFLNSSLSSTGYFLDSFLHTFVIVFLLLKESSVKNKVVVEFR